MSKPAYPKKLLLASAIFTSILFFLVLCSLIAEFTYLAIKKKLYFQEIESVLSEKDLTRNSFKRYRSKFTVSKDRLKQRILAVGGSTTYGFGVSALQTWPALLEIILEKHAPGRYEVINLGRLGGHLEEFSENFLFSLNEFIPREKWLRGSPEQFDQVPRASWGWRDLSPDLIILAPIVNDTAPDYLAVSSFRPTARLANNLRFRCVQTFFCESMALGYFFKKFMWLVENRGSSSLVDESEKLAIIQKRYERSLEHFLDLWDSKTAIYLVGLPLLFNKDDGEKEARQAGMYWSIDPSKSLMAEVNYLPKLIALEEAVREGVALRRGLPYKELGESIKSLTLKKRIKYYLDSAHLDAKGNELIAREIWGTFFKSQNSFLKTLSFSGL